MLLELTAVRAQYYIFLQKQTHGSCSCECCSNRYMFDCVSFAATDTYDHNYLYDFPSFLFFLFPLALGLHGVVTLADTFLLSIEGKLAIPLFG